MSKFVKASIIIILVLAVSLSLVACGASTPRSDTPDGGDIISNNTQNSDNGKNNAGIQNGASNADVTYAASFETNSGSPVKAIQIWVIEKAPVTTRSGYVFIGWYLEPNFSGTVLTFPYKLTRDTKFYACWQSVGTKAIKNINDLKAIGEDEASLAGDYYLTNDIYLTGEDWIPIGLKYETNYAEDGVTIDSIKLVGEDAPQAFVGNINGNGYTIYDLSIKPICKEKELNYLPYGLFARFATKGKHTATVKNLRFSGFNITLGAALSKFYIGALVGKMDDGIIENCHAIGKVTNPKLIYEEGMWDDFFGSYANPTERTYIGGLVGIMQAGIITKCATGGDITSESVAERVYIGGVLGFNGKETSALTDEEKKASLFGGGTVSYCSSSMAIKARYAGGVVGYNAKTITNCYATGAMSGNLAYPTVAGGLLAYNDYTGTVSQSYATGAVSARTAGGLIGINNFNYIYGAGGVIADCYSTSQIIASEYGGGLIARAEAKVSIEGKKNHSPLITDKFFIIKNCFAYGDVTVDVQDVYYTNDKGDIIKTSGVYHSVFAGGLIGRANEPRLSGCVALGNVKARSMRPNGDGAVYNSVYADNLVGQATNLISNHKNVFGFKDQIVYRNEDLYTNKNTSAPLIGVGIGQISLDNSEFLRTTLGFSELIWNLENIDIANGRIPTLK